MINIYLKTLPETYNNIFLIHIIITITLDPLNPGVVIYYPPALEGFSRLS